MAAVLRLMLLGTALVVSAPHAATTTVWKCAGEAGSVVYQDVPCPVGKELRNLTTEPPSLSIVPGTPVPGAASPRTSASRSERASTPERRKTATGSAADRRFIQVGMSAVEVVQRIGKPDIDGKNRRGGQRWSYLPNEGDPNTITTLTLIDGKVADVERKIVR